MVEQCTNFMYIYKESVSRLNEKQYVKVWLTKYYIDVQKGGV